MSTELEVRQSDSLALSSEQSYWNDRQLATLRHMGVEGASEGDLMVFHHVCQKTGLDPFARQIHMIGRNTKNQRTNQWETKYTIQTGIDGFRLIGRRAADQRGATISIEPPQWAHADGGWRDVWTPAWGMPIAARVTIKRGGEPFTAVALFDEYKQTKKDGGLTSMWAQRPAGQLAKCAEALAWRMAFPQDLSGLYTDDEMGQADRVQVEQVEQPAAGPDRMRGILGKPAADPEPEQPADIQTENTPGTITSAQVKKIAAAMGDLDLKDRAIALQYVSEEIGREVTSRNDLSKNEASMVIEALQRDINERNADTTTGEIHDAEVVDAEPTLPDPTDEADPWASGGTP